MIADPKKIQVGDVLDREILEQLLREAIAEASWRTTRGKQVGKIWVDRIATVAGLLGRGSEGIACGYSCSTCGADFWIVAAPRGSRESIEQLERRIAAACGRDHRARLRGRGGRPCKADELELEIPTAAVALGPRRTESSGRSGA